MSVYFAESCGFIKIGFARDVFQRIGTVTKNGKRPDVIPRGSRAHLLGWVPGDQWREGVFHARFIETRVAGEWFALSREDVLPLIWDDPSGVDVTAMSFQAVSIMHRQPEATRADLEAAGIRVIAAEEHEWLAGLDRILSSVRR